MDVSKLDKQTLEFAMKIAWQYGMTCKDTKEGRTKKQSYKQVEDTLKHYLDELN